MSRTTILVVVLILIIGGAVLLFRQPSSVEEKHLSAERITLAGHRDDGSTAWSIQAQAGELNQDDGILETVELTFYEGEDEHIVVTSDQLSRDTGGSTLSGSVVVKEADALSLESETIFWDERNNVLESGPVTIKMELASIEAGAFHHDLEANLTTLTHGVEAQLIQDDVKYVASSNAAKATSDLLILLGDVSIQSEDGNSYHCQQLESDVSGSSIHLIDGVSGSWQQSAFLASSVHLDAEGIRLGGDVTIDLELLMMDESHDS